MKADVDATVGLVRVFLNGREEQMPEGLSVAGLLARLRLVRERVAVEVDGAIVRKADYETTPIRPDARVEIVSFVGGG